MKKLSKIYLETTNVCNLSCSFCHGTHREKQFMSLGEFDKIIQKISGKSKYLYLHLMGEPLLNPEIPQMAKSAHDAGFEVMLTTNGTLLSQKGEFIYKNGNIKKVSISVQAVDILNGTACQISGKYFEKYITEIADFSYKCAESGVICVLRLWNLDGDNDKNSHVLKKLHELFPDEWIKNRSGFKLLNAPLGEKEVYLEFGEKFDWPDENSSDIKNVSFCYALRDQIGILCDGTVVPCCLDADGTIALGNIFDSELEEILSTPRAADLLRSFEDKAPCEKLCLTCGYASRFK